MAPGTLLRWILLPLVVGALGVRWVYLLARRIGQENCYSDCVSGADVSAAGWMFFAAVIGWCLVLGWHYWPRDLTRNRSGPPRD